jgi:uncharacterized protein (TIGR02271 family)
MNTATSKRETVVGVFEDRRPAQQAVEDLKNAGFRDDQIGVVARDAAAGGAVPDAGKAGETTEKHGSHWEEGAAIGAATGAGVGALWALGIVAGFLPAIGPAIAGGVLASVLASAAGGAAVAGVVGALIGLGIPEEEARFYEDEFKAGRTLVTVKADGRYDEAWTILSRNGAYDMKSGRPAAAGATAAQAGGQTMKLHEEELRARKTPVQTGEVDVRKEVHTEHKTLNVPVTREEIVIERRPAHGAASKGDVRPGEEVRIPVREEKVHVEKEAVVKEEVSVGKRKVTENQQVGGTVRKEEVRVDEKGDVDVRNRKK